MRRFNPTSTEGMTLEQIQAERRRRMAYAELIPVTVDGFDPICGEALIFWDVRKSSWAWIGWIGRKLQSAKFLYGYRELEQAVSQAGKFLSNLKANLDRRADLRAAEKAKRAEVVNSQSAPIGSIFVSSWGYEQTNVNAYQVIGHFGRLGVVLREVHCAAVAGSSVSHGMADECKPIPGAFKEGYRSEVLRKKLNAEGRIKVDSCEGTASLWDGDRSFYRSWYA